MTPKIKCLAVDDEPLALELVKGYIEQTPFLELAGTCDSALEAISFLESHEVQLIFLDIQMPGLTGTSLMRSLKNKPRVIFTTAYEEYALEGFRLDAVDYLLKPFDYEEFLRAAQKARDLFLLEAGMKNEIPDNDYFFIKSDYKLVKVVIADITHIEGLKDYVKIYLTSSPKPLLTLMSLKNLESLLPSDRFLRVHRSFIINIRHITGIERNLLHLHNMQIPMSESYKSQLMEMINDKIV